MHIAIIGTAGRGEDKERLTKDIYTKAISLVRQAVSDLSKSYFLHALTLPRVHLHSGGAAWMDHIAVKLYLEETVSGLSIWGPCSFDISKHKFVEQPIGPNSRFDPGRISNWYHVAFSTVVHDGDPTVSRKEITHAIAQGAHFIEGNGFHRRNSDVAEQQGLIALTYGDGPRVKDGGTADTVKKYLKYCKKMGQPVNAIHFDLHDMSRHDTIEVS